MYQICVSEYYVVGTRLKVAQGNVKNHKADDAVNVTAKIADLDSPGNAISSKFEWQGVISLLFLVNLSWNEERYLREKVVPDRAAEATIFWRLRLRLRFRV